VRERHIHLGVEEEAPDRPEAGDHAVTEDEAKEEWAGGAIVRHPAVTQDDPLSAQPWTKVLLEYALGVRVDGRDTVAKQKGTAPVFAQWAQVATEYASTVLETATAIGANPYADAVAGLTPEELVRGTEQTKRHLQALLL
jgi:hypothetical protein